MFKRKVCKNCKEKVNEKHSFCPSCGHYMHGKNKQEDFGMLGRNDSRNEEFDPFAGLFGGMTGKMLGKMLNNTMKMLEKEMKKEMGVQKQSKIQPRTKVRLSINGQEINLNEEQAKKEKEIVHEMPSIELSKDAQKKFASLTKKEPLTSIRRLSDSVIYEIKIPGVKSINDISIQKVGDSIEIKALSKDQAYMKIIPINLPIVDYNLSRGKLILELKE